MITWTQQLKKAPWNRTTRTQFLEFLQPTQNIQLTRKYMSNEYHPLLTRKLDPPATYLAPIHQRGNLEGKICISTKSSIQYNTDGLIESIGPEGRCFEKKKKLCILCHFYTIDLRCLPCLLYKAMLGKPSKKVCVFLLDIVQKWPWPPPPHFEHPWGNFCDSPFWTTVR